MWCTGGKRKSVAMLDIRNGSLILLNDSFEWEGKFTKELSGIAWLSKKIQSRNLSIDGLNRSGTSSHLISAKCQKENSISFPNVLALFERFSNWRNRLLSPTSLDNCALIGKSFFIQQKTGLPHSIKLALADGQPYKMRIAISPVYTYSSVSVKNYDQIPPWERKSLKNVPQSQRAAS